MSIYFNIAIATQHAHTKKEYNNNNIKALKRSNCVEKI